ncbi:PPP1R21, partial [Symbiodinium sp. CCMP2456]
MADDERLLKLKEKYNQLKQANGVLKKGLLDKQEECARLEQQLKERDSTIREQLEEIDHLQFQNGRMSKQLGTLTAQ